MSFGGLGGGTEQSVNPGGLTPEIIAGLLSLLGGGALPANLGGLIEGPVRNFPTAPGSIAPVIPPRPVSPVPRGGGGGLTEGRGGGGGSAEATQNRDTLASAGTVDTFEQWLEAVGIGMSLFGAFTGSPVSMLGLVGRGVADTQAGISPIDRFGGTLPSVAREQAREEQAKRKQEGAREQASEQAERTRAARARERENDSGDLGRGRSPTGSDIEGTPF